MLFIVAIALALVAYVLIRSGMRGVTIQEYLTGVLQ